MKKFILVLVLLLAWGACMYGAYWVCKHVSYALFYRSMVQQTVRDMVKAEALK